MHGLNRPIKDRTIKIKLYLANINGSLTKLPLITLNIPPIAPTADVKPNKDEGEFTDEIDKFRAIIRHVSIVAEAISHQVCLESKNYITVMNNMEINRD